MIGKRKETPKKRPLPALIWPSRICHQVEGPPFVCCPRLLIQYIRSYLPYPVAVSTCGRAMPWWQATHSTYALRKLFIIGVRPSPLGTSAAVRPRMLMIQMSMEQLAGQTHVLGENSHQYHLVHHKSHMIWPRPPRREARDNRLSYGMAKPYRI
jgi:hypothetical protein